MKALIPRLRSLKAWQLGALTLAIFVLPLGLLGSVTMLASSNSADARPGEAAFPVANQTGPAEISMSGLLVFPRRLALTFDTGGEVGEILVEEGQRVVEGQALARLDAVTVSILEQAVAQAQLDLDQARDALDEAKEEFVLTPLESAVFQENIATARVAVDDAREALDDFHRDHARTQAKARETRAVAEESLDDGLKALDDFHRNHARDLAGARETKATAEMALDNAERKLADFERDQGLDLARARDQVAKAEVTLDQAREDLADFDIDYIDELTQAAQDVADKEDLLESAKDALGGFITQLGITQSFNQEVEEADSGITVVEQLRRLEVAVERGRSNLEQARDTLAKLQKGPDLLKLADLEVAVEVAETSLVKTQTDLAKEARGLDEFVLRSREAAVEVARTALAQAEIDLTELEDGPNDFQLRKLEAAVEVARTALAQAEIDLVEEEEGPDPVALALKEKQLVKAREDFADLTGGPDPLEVQVKEAQVAAAQARLEDSLKDFEGTVLRAPFDGIVSLINGEIEDLVSKESRVIEVTDPGVVEVDGVVDAVDIQAIKPGAGARVTIPSVPGMVFDGIVSSVAAEPRTERGVLGYPVTVKVELPPGTEVPVSLSSVSISIIP